MTWTLVWMSMTLAAGTADNAQESFDAEELKEADAKMEKALPAEAKELEKDMKKARKRLDEKKKGEGAAEPDAEGSHEETGDWAEQERWERYNKRAKEHGHEHKHRKPRGKRGVEGDGPWVGAKRPQIFQPRKPFIGLLLGGLVGFGTGYFYSGELRKGILFAGIDVVLVAGFVGATVALNRLVVEHDFRSGKSLARDERDFGKREANLYATSIVLALATVGSHAFQAVGGFRSSKRTNETLRSFAFVPTGNGAAFLMTW